MMFEIRKYTLWAAMVLGVLALSACANFNSVSAGGNSNNVTWPEPSEATFEGGSYPDLDDLRKVREGMTKEQIYALIGRPHYREGFMGVQVWDYLFNFPTADGVRQCQYKILFDKNMLASTFLWKPKSCAGILNQNMTKTFTLSGDMLFAFDSSQLSAQGEAEIAKIAEQLEQYEDVHITVVGYTDRIGSEAYNMALSRRRAQSVRDALVSQGIDPDRITAVGRGESNPVVHCTNDSREELIACLAPNRRVQVTSMGHE